MALVAGTITINPDGSFSGTGLAYALLVGKVAAADFVLAASGHGPLSSQPTAHRLYALNIYKTECEAFAAALVTALSTVDVRIPADALDTGIPSIDRVVPGALE